MLGLHPAVETLVAQYQPKLILELLVLELLQHSKRVSSGSTAPSKPGGSGAKHQQTHLCVVGVRTSRPGVAGSAAGSHNLLVLMESLLWAD